MTRLRFSSHNLKKETGRYGSKRVPRSERKCLCCSSEYEFHFVIQCAAYKEIRNSYIKAYLYQRPSVYMFVELLICNKRSAILSQKP